MFPAVDTKETADFVRARRNSSESGTPEMSVASGDEEGLDDGDSKTDNDNENDNNNNDRELLPPDAPFYDPTTGQIMTDPVVHPSGDSYDKSSLFDSPDTFYPNRALKAIIVAARHEVAAASTPSALGSARQIDESVRSSKSVSKSVFVDGGRQNHHRPLPESYYCPILCDLMVDPVITPDGNSYERAAIVNWVNINHMSPVTRNPLTVSDLRPNNALYTLIQIEKSVSVESMHPSIRQWQDSGMDTSTRNLEPMNNSEHGAGAQPALAVSSATAPTNEEFASALPITHAEIRMRNRSTTRIRESSQQRSSERLATAPLVLCTFFVLFVGIAIMAVLLPFYILFLVGVSIMLILVAMSKVYEARNNSNAQ